MPSVHTITIYESYFTEDDIYDGDIAYSRTVETKLDLVPDWEDSFIDLAVQALENHGCTEASCSPLPSPEHCTGIWFSDPDGSYIVNYGTGERCQTSIHFDREVPGWVIHTIGERVGCRV